MGGRAARDAEIALIVQREPAEVRSELARVAYPLAVGPEAYWSLEPVETLRAA